MKSSTINRYVLGLALGGLAVLASPASAQQFELNGPQETIPSQRILDEFGVRTGTIQRLSLPTTTGEPFQVVVTVRGRAKLLSLSPYDVRSSNFQLMVDDGQGPQQVPTPASVTYRGHVDGHPESRAAASLYDGQLRALFFLAPGEEIWGVDPVTEVDANAPRWAHLVYDSRDNLPLPGRCGNQEMGAPVLGGNRGGDEVLRLAEIACDGDREWYVAEGSNTTNAMNKITTIINNVGIIYERDVEIRYTITRIIIRTTTVYTTTDAGSLLRQFQNRWNASHGNVQRDVAHLFTGKNLNGSVIGVAYLGVICNLSSAYGLSQRLGNGNNTSMTGLVAHELGHNWNAPHCSGGDCRIMCPGLGGCAGDLSRFGQASINSIVAFKNTRNCLGNPSRPVLSSVSPNNIPIFPAGQRITLTGQNFSGTIRVFVGPVQLTPPGQVTIVSDTEIQFGSPQPGTLGTFGVTVQNGGGLSNSLPMTFTDTNPPGLSAPIFSVQQVPLDFAFGGRANNTAVVIAAFNDNSTVPFMGFQILAASPITLFFGTLDARGLGSFQIPGTPSSLFGLVMWSQMADIQTVPPALIGVTPPQQTQFF